jgi:hypothetical protein
MVALRRQLARLLNVCGVARIADEPPEDLADCQLGVAGRARHIAFAAPAGAPSRTWFHTVRGRDIDGPGNVKSLPSFLTQGKVDARKVLPLPAEQHCMKSQSTSRFAIRLAGRHEPTELGRLSLVSWRNTASRI